MALNFGDSQVVHHPKDGTAIFLANETLDPTMPDRPEVKSFYTSNRTGKLHIVLKTEEKDGFEYDVEVTEEHIRMFRPEYDAHMAQVEMDGDVYPLTALNLNASDLKFFGAWGVTSCNILAKVPVQEIEFQVENEIIPNKEYFLKQCLKWREMAQALIAAGQDEESELPITPAKKAKPRAQATA